MGIGIHRAPFGSEFTAGSGTWFDDLRVAPNARATGPTVPTFGRVQRDLAGTSNGVYLYQFDNAAAGSEKEVHFQMQMPHGKLLGSAINVHVHWLPVTAGTAGHTIRWGLEYTWAHVGESFPVTATVYGDTPVVGAIDVALSHCITPFPALTPPAGEDVSSILMCRLFRASANAADTATITAGVLFVDAHVEMDRLGSRDEYEQ